MKHPFTPVAVSAMALSLALCCSGAGRAPACPAPAPFKPMVARDVDFALGVNLDREQASKVVDAYCTLAFNVLVQAQAFGKGDDIDIQEIKQKLAEFKDDPFKEAPENVRRFLERSGLRRAEFRWAVLSLSNFKIVDDTPRLGGLALAIAGTVDLKRVIEAVRQEGDGTFAFEETGLCGETAWHFVPQKVDKKLADAHVDPYVTSLDGQLVLLSLSREALVQQIRLYRGGSGDGTALRGFSAADGEWLHLHVSGIGDWVREYAPRDELKGVNQLIPNGDELILGLGDLDVDERVQPDGMLSSDLVLRMASEKDADSLRTLAKTGLMVLAAQIAAEPKVPDFVKKIVGDVKVGGADGRFEVHAPIPVGTCCGILPAALFPAISGALLSANLSTMSLQGRKLVTGLIQANVERASAGLGPVWPRTELEEASKSDEDVAGKAFRSSTDYFRTLFDLAQYGSSDWDPTLDGELLSSLWGCGVPGMAGKVLEMRNVAWIVAANVTDETPDDIPVLITANFNPSLLLRKWDGATDRLKRLPIGPASGARATPLGDKGIVIVRKSGAAEAIKAKHLTYGTLYRNQAFDLTNMKPPLMYLTPSGVVEPVGLR